LGIDKDLIKTIALACVFPENRPNISQKMCHRAFRGAAHLYTEPREVLEEGRKEN
jgi:hypothetical protein